MNSLLTGEIAWYVTGRFYLDTDDAIADYGYFLRLAGIAPLFDGAISETTAHFTFAAEPFKASSVNNGALSLSLDPVGQFALFLQRRPQANFDDPASFARGEKIATFRRNGLVVGTTVDRNDAPPAHALISSNLFTAQLIESQPFEFAGTRYDLRKIIGYGITQLGTAAATAVDPPSKRYSSVIPFTGSAIKVG